MGLRFGTQAGQGPRVHVAPDGGEVITFGWDGQFEHEHGFSPHFIDHVAGIRRTDTIEALWPLTNVGWAFDIDADDNNFHIMSSSTSEYDLEVVWAQEGGHANAGGPVEVCWKDDAFAVWFRDGALADLFKIAIRKGAAVFGLVLRDDGMMRNRQSEGFVATREDAARWLIEQRWIIRSSS